MRLWSGAVDLLLPQSQQPRLEMRYNSNEAWNWYWWIVPDGRLRHQPSPKSLTYDDRAWLGDSKVSENWGTCSFRYPSSLRPHRWPSDYVDGCYMQNGRKSFGWCGPYCVVMLMSPGHWTLSIYFQRVTFTLHDIEDSVYGCYFMKNNYYSRRWNWVGLQSIKS